MRNSKIMKNHRSRRLNELSDEIGDMSMLLEAGMDRSAYDQAIASIEPLSELEDIIGSSMPKTSAEIRSAISNVNAAITKDPSLMMQVASATGLSKPQQHLIDAITSAEVLKFSILNAMDAVRMLFITDFKKSEKYYEDEVIFFDIKAASPTGAQPILAPQRIPFSKISEIGDYEIYRSSDKHMVIGKESAASGRTISIPITGRGRFITLNHVPVGKIYLTGRNSDGHPAPLPLATKETMLNIKPPAAGPGVLGQKVKDLAQRSNKKFDLDKVVKDNFKIPATGEGIIVGIYRSLNKSPAIKPTKLPASDFSSELGELTLQQFRKYYEALVSRTSSATGDMSTFDLADTLFFTGLAAVSGMLGIAPPPAPAGASGGSSSGPVTSAGGGSGSPGGGAAGGVAGGGSASRSHSLNNFLNSTSFVKGANPAERSANKAALDGIIDRDALRRELNKFVGPGVVFTESVDRWCKLAGIKEEK